MLVASPPCLPLPSAAVLLVLLPPAAAGGGPPVRAATREMLDRLQQRLGAAIQVLVVDEANDPAVVRSFHVPTLPAFLLVQQGLELWRQPGLPEGEAIAEQLLRRVGLPGNRPT